MEPFYSIIIPVYNVEQYLDRCLESVLHQDWTDYEIILVNDGSTDASESICRRYADGDKIVLISKENGGLSSARNAGIAAAKGQYVILLDSDDYIEQNCLALLADVIKHNNANVYMIKARTIYEDGEQHDVHSDQQCRVYTKEEYLSALKLFRACAPYMIYKRNFLETRGLRFYEGILHEDELWAPQVLLNVDLICTTNILVYYHCLRRGSITQSNNFEERGSSLLIVLKELLKLPGFEMAGECRILRNHWAFLFLEAVFFLNADERLVKQYSRRMPYQFSLTGKMKVKSILYAISPRLYLLIHKIAKQTIPMYVNR